MKDSNKKYTDEKMAIKGLVFSATSVAITAAGTTTAVFGLITTTPVWLPLAAASGGVAVAYATGKAINKIENKYKKKV